MYPPQFSPGWGPMAAPPGRARLWPRVRHQLLIVGALLCGALLLGILRNRAGLLAVALAWVIIGFIANRGWRVVIEYAAVVGLVLALGAAGAGAARIDVAAAHEAPAEQAAEAKGYLQEARQGVINLWAQIAQGFPGPSPTPKAKPKEHH